ncbi:unnamed protein product [Caenorhabditis brenneri]
MEEPKGPLSLFKLACDALCNSAKNGNLNSHFDPQKVPPAIRQCIWEHCSLMDIITLSSAMDSTEFFSPIARSHADEISMTFSKFFNGKCAFRIKCVGKSMLTWHIRPVKQHSAYTEFSNTFYPVFTLTIGDVHKLTRMMYDSLHIKVFESNSLDPPRTTQTAVANWLHQLFQKAFEKNID